MDKIQKPDAPRVTTESHIEDVRVGQWYWVKQENDQDGEKTDEWLGCVVHVGSNYLKIEGPGSHPQSSLRTRVHFKNFWETCRLEPNAEAILKQRIGTHQANVKRLLAEVQEITAHLGIGSVTALPSGNETQALALRGSGQPIEDYKKALVKAQEKTLPDLFQQIKHETGLVAVWMSAMVIPLEAKAGLLEPVIESIKARIFNVELYAGLIEEIVQVSKGKPAARDEPIRLFQSRYYMDEECLVDYQHGGMTFKSIKEFDAWLAKPQHRNRILPFPRAIAAFRVRRHDKEVEFGNISDFIRFMLSGERDADKMTFLYMRNGDQLFRLKTGIDFGVRLFPDQDQQFTATDQLYATKDGEQIISKAAYDTMVEGEKRARKEAKEKYEKDLAAYKKAEAEEPAKQAAYKKALEEYEKVIIKWRKNPEGPEPEKPNKPTWIGHEPWFHEWGDYNGSHTYEPFNKDNVYYDDILRRVKSNIDEHNRLVIVLQGILDRSPTMHPHPNWQLWSEEGFRAALRLVYDDSRALTSGAAPDFEAYRARLNAQITVGSITVGQEICWEEAEAVKENDRMARSFRGRSHDFRYKRFTPYGNPGPGTLAKVTHYSKKKGTCTFEWERERLRAKSYWQHGSDFLKSHFTCPVSRLLNVSAYKPGDFRQFYEDRRTRANYLQWAPLLLEAEEYWAGNRDKMGKPSKSGPAFEFGE